MTIARVGRIAISAAAPREMRPGEACRSRSNQGQGPLPSREPRCTRHRRQNRPAPAPEVGSAQEQQLRESPWELASRPAQEWRAEEPGRLRRTSARLSPSDSAMAWALAKASELELVTGSAQDAESESRWEQESASERELAQASPSARAYFAVPLPRRPGQKLKGRSATRHRRQRGRHSCLGALRAALAPSRHRRCAPPARFRPRIE